MTITTPPTLAAHVDDMLADIDTALLELDMIPGAEEAAVLAECDAAEYRLAATTVLRGLARTEAVDLSAHDLAGMHIGLPDMSALD